MATPKNPKQKRFVSAWNNYFILPKRKTLVRPIFLLLLFLCGYDVICQAVGIHACKFMQVVMDVDGRPHLFPYLYPPSSSFVCVQLFVSSMRRRSKRARKQPTIEDFLLDQIYLKSSDCLKLRSPWRLNNDDSPDKKLANPLLSFFFVYNVAQPILVRPPTYFTSLLHLLSWVNREVYSSDI